MANDGNVNSCFRHLDLGKFPPWQLTVTLPGGEKRHIKIPYSEGDHVVGLPLGLDVPEVIAKNYKDLLCMVNGMTYIICNLTRKLERQQQDAARSLDDANRYRLELQELKCKIDGGMAVSQEVMASISSSKKRKLSTEESGPREATSVRISEQEHLPSTRSSNTPAIPVLLVQESDTEDNVDDLPFTSETGSQGEDVTAGTSVDSPEVQTEKVIESVAVVGPIREPVDAMMTSSSPNCLTVVDPTTLTTAAPIESTSVSGQGGEERCEYVATKNVIKSNMLNCDGLVDTSLHYENQLEFATRGEAKKWVLEKGKEKNCIIVTGKQSTPNRIVMVCKRSGKQESHKAKDYKYPDNKTPRIYKPKIPKCECPFKIVIRKTFEDVWKMQVANGCHNHEDSESPVVHPAGAKLKPEKIIKSNMLNCDGLVDTSLHYENQLEFATRDEAKKWVLEKGKEKNCIIVSGRQSTPERFVLVCQRSGKFRNNHAKDSKYYHKTPRFKTTKCGCPFKIVLKKSKGENGVWKMIVANGCHNHEDLESPVVHPAGAKRKRRKISKLQMENCDDGHPAGAKLKRRISKLQMENCDDGHPAGSKRKRRKISKLQMENCDDGLVGVGVQGHCSTRPPPTPSQQPSHFSSPGPSFCTTQLSQNPVNLPETLNFTQMISSPSGRQDIGMMGWNDATSQMQPVSSSMRSPTPAITLALSAPQLPYGASFNQGLSSQFYNQLAQVAQPPTSSTGHSTVAPNDPARSNFQPPRTTNDRNYFSLNMDF